MLMICQFKNSASLKMIMVLIFPYMEQLSNDSVLLNVPDVLMGRKTGNQSVIGDLCCCFPWALLKIVLKNPQ